MHGKGGKQKQGKKSPKWASGGHLVMHTHSAKNQEVGSDGHAGQRVSFRGMQGNQEVGGTA